MYTSLLFNLLSLGTGSPFWIQTNLCYSSSYQIENLNYGHMNKIPQWQSVTVQPHMFITAICVLDGNENVVYWTALSCHLDSFSVCTFVIFASQRLIVTVSLADNSVYEREGQRSGTSVFQVHFLSYTILFIPSSSPACLSFLLAGPS